MELLADIHSLIVGQFEKREQHAVRASHAKSSACVVGTLTIADDLPPELAQGLFAAAGTYDVAIRFAEGTGETLGDRVSTHRGMTIKVFGVQVRSCLGMMRQRRISSSPRDERSPPARQAAS